MTLFSSLYTGVNGMNAQTQSTSAISNNIANLTTTGYKRYDTTFYDVVTSTTKGSGTGLHGDSATTLQRIDRQGQLQQTGFSTDLGISGEGFFIVRASDDGSGEQLYTRNGSFSPDVNGVLRNSSGFALYGWAVDEFGVAGTTLEAIDVDNLNATWRQTTAAQLSFNLDGSETNYNPQVLGNPALPVSTQSIWDTVNLQTIDSSEQANFSRNITMFDNLGNPRQITFEFRKVIGPMAYATSNTSGATSTTSLTDPKIFGNNNAGDSFTVDVGGTIQEYVIGAAAGPGQVRVDTVGDLTNHLNSTFGGGNVADAALDESGRLIIRAVSLIDSITFADTNGTPLFGGNSTLNFSNAVYNPTVDPTINNAGVNPNQSDFPPLENTTNPNSYGWWEMRVLKPADPSLDMSLDAAYGQPQEISKGLLNFNADGTLNTAKDPITGLALDGTLSISSGSFDATLTGEDINVEVDIGRMSQFAGSYNALIADQNGAEAGTFVSLSIDTEGRVIAKYSNNEEIPAYQIPLATFVNPNGLLDRTGTVFSQTADAGDLMIGAAGTGGAGLIQAKTLENSNVDLGEEFAKLIVSQRAYSASSRIVTTVDEMTEILRSLKR